MRQNHGPGTDGVVVITNIGVDPEQTCLFDCDNCPIIARVDGALKVCSCECRSCKRKWFDDRRPIVRDGKIFRYGDREPVEEKKENAMALDGLAPGMVVCLKSGGPSMTLEEIETGRDDKAVCSWFDSTFPDRLHRQRFSLHALQAVEAKAAAK